MTDENTKKEEVTKEQPVVEAREEKQAEKPAAKKVASAKQAKYTRTAKGKRRAVRQVARGCAYINASLNNTIVTITDINGNTLTWSSAGSVGFRGPKKATPYAASILINKLADKMEAIGIKELSVFVTGIGSGRDSAIRTLNSKGFNITSIKELTPEPHNGCRARRPRRV